MAPAPQWVTKDFLKHIIKRAIHREISISDDEIIDYISEKRNHKIKSTTWIVYVNDKINKEPELKELMCEHMETLLGVTDDEVKKLEEHNFENLRGRLRSRRSTRRRRQQGSNVREMCPFVAVFGPLSGPGVGLDATPTQYTTE